MKEYVSEAVVLSVYPVRENDRVVTLFTRELGKIDVKVVAARKLASKFAAHLDPLNLVRARFVKKNNFTLTDVLSEDRFSPLRGRTGALGDALRLLSLLDGLLASNVPEPRVWHALLGVLGGNRFEPKLFLKLLGYDPLHASCAECNARHVSAFSAKDQSFLCANCARAFGGSELLLLN